MELPAKVRGVTFDVTGTLLHPHPSVGAIYAAGLARGGLPAPSAAALDAAFATAFAGLPRPVPLDAPADRAWWAEVVRRTLGPACPPERFPGVFDELWEAFARPEHWRVEPGAPETLARLRAGGRKVALLSNFDARLRPLLAGLGWAGGLDAVVLSVEVGAEKPAPAIFRAAEGALGLPPSALLHVGDSARADLAGALAAGWRAAGLRADYPGAARVETLAELA